MRGTSDLHLLESPLPELLRQVTGLSPDRSGSHVLLDELGVRSTQRLALADVGGGVVAFTWPGELSGQARYLYAAGRASELLAAARETGWEVDMRPHLGFWRSRPVDRLYTNPAIDVHEYVARWTGQDGRRIGQHDYETIRTHLWPWLLERGFASREDEAELEPFLERLRARGMRPAHLRPGLRLLRRWSRDDVARLELADGLASEVRCAVNRVLVAVADPQVVK